MKLKFPPNRPLNQRGVNLKQAIATRDATDPADRGHRTWGRWDRPFGMHPTAPSKLLSAMEVPA